MIQHPDILLGGFSLAEGLFEPICHLYDAVFSRPPFHGTPEDSARQRERLTRLMANPAFGIAASRVGTDLIGFAYGVPLEPGTRWWNDFLEPVAEEVTTEWDGRTFAVIDLAVAEPLRRQGIGRRLLTTLLESRREQRATLAVRPDATGTQAFYRRLGWQRVGRLKSAPGAPSPFFDIYVLSLERNP